VKALWICRCSGAKGMWHNLDERRSLQPPAMQVFRSASMPPASLLGTWDRLAVEQIIDNLVSNAIKYGAHRPVEIFFEDRGDNVCIQVRDHGPGISADVRARIFGRFERAVGPDDAAASPALRRAPKPETAPGPRSLIVLSGARARISRSPIRPLVPRATPSANGCDPGTIGVTPGSQHQANFSKVRQWSATMSADYCSCFGPPPFQAIRRRLPGPAGHARSREPSEFDLIATRQPV